jgi:outer membrane protein assembly factor BamB
MRMSMLRWSPLLLAGLLQGCGSWFGGAVVEPPAELPEIAADARVEPRTLWSRDVGVGTDDRRLALRPWIEAERIYVADSAGEVTALQAADGKTLWEVDLDLPLAGGPGVGAGLVLVGTSDAELIALDQETGAEQWRTSVSSEVLSTPAAAVNTVVAHTVDGKLFGLDAATGTEVWRYEREVPVLTLRGSSSPVIDGTTVYCGLAGGKLLALDLASGAPVWETNVSVPSGRSELERMVDIDGDPLLYGSSIFVATYQGDVAAIGQASGTLLWRRQLSSYSGLAADWQNLYVSDAQGHVWALDGYTGAARWRQEALYNRQLSAPAVVGNFVVVGDFEGYLHWLAPDDGRVVGRSRIGRDPISAAPRVRDGVLYVLGDGGELAAVQLPDQAAP